MRKRFLRPLFVLLFSVSAASQSAQQPSSNQSRDISLASDVEGKVSLPAGVPRGYALIIGVSQYQKLDRSKQLRFPETDAEAVYRVLISQRGGAFPAENVKLLTGPKATLANIRQELEVWLPSVAQPADRVIVYFAGHGFVKDGRGYLAGFDVDPDKLETTGYPMVRLGEVMASRVKSHWKLLLTDACHSGKITPETTDEAVDRELNALPKNFLTLSATTEREQSYEDPNLATGFGLFTYFVVQAWEGNADHDPCDGVITADELVEYVRSNVRRYAREKHLNQTPTARGDYEPNMLLGVSNSCGEGPAPPSMQGTAVVEANVDDVDLYVDGKLVAKLSRSKPLTLPALSTGLHEFKGVKQGYEPDRKEIMIAPGQESTVTLRIRYARRISKAAQDLNDQGENLLYTRRSSINPLNIAPVSRSQSESDLRNAAALFTRALGEDPNYSKAAYNLGQANQLLSDEEASLKAYRKAIEIDPGYVDARNQYAGVLIEHGDADEAIRELTDALRMDANDEVYSLIARAYWDKGVWNRCVEFADKALALRPANAQAHLWKADALRQLAALERTPARQIALYMEARDHFRTFVDVTNFSTSATEWFAFHFIGGGLGSRRHADRQESYNSLRSSGYLGLCLCEAKVGNPRRAREYCQRGLKYQPNDADRTFPAGQHQSRSVQPGAVLRLSEGGGGQLYEDAGAQS